MELRGGAGAAAAKAARAARMAAIGSLLPQDDPSLRAMQRLLRRGRNASQPSQPESEGLPLGGASSFLRHAPSAPSAPAGGLGVMLRRGGAGGEASLGAGGRSFIFGRGDESNGGAAAATADIAAPQLGVRGAAAAVRAAAAEAVTRAAVQGRTATNGGSNSLLGLLRTHSAMPEGSAEDARVLAESLTANLRKAGQVVCPGPGLVTAARRNEALRR